MKNHCKAVAAAVITCTLTSTLWPEAYSAEFLGDECQMATNTLEPREIVVDNITRDVQVHCPFDDVAQTLKTGVFPLVIALHGGGGRPDLFAADTQLVGYSNANARVSDLGPFLLILPEALDADEGNFTAGNWNDGAEGNNNPGEDDVAFINDIITAALDDYDGVTPSEFSIDEDRIYLLGFSNGASMVNRAAVNLSHRLAGIGSVSGRLPAIYDNFTDPVSSTAAVATPTFWPSTSLAAIFVHEDAAPVDWVCPVEGNTPVFFAPFDNCVGDCLRADSGALMEVPAAVTRWATQHNGCTTSASTPLGDSDGNPATTVNQTVYSGCNAGVGVEFYRMEGAGHHWPSGASTPTDLCDDDPDVLLSHGLQSDDIMATEVILDFFADYTRVIDTDGDGIADVSDNCTKVPNPSQIDSNLDGYGNWCDPDFAEFTSPDCRTDVNDNNYAVSLLCLTPPCDADADLNGDGLVTQIDFNILQLRLFRPPGPSTDASLLCSPR